MRLIDVDALLKETMEHYCADCDRRKGIKRGKLTLVYEIGDAPCRACGTGDMIETLEDAPTVDAVEAIPVEWLENLMNECAESDVGLNNDIFRVLTKWTREQMYGGEHDEAD